jgi:hypothetical protein
VESPDDADASFQVGRHTVYVKGQTYELSGVPVVIDEEFGEQTGETEVAIRLADTLVEVHPRLRTEISQIVVPDCVNPDGKAAATSNMASKQVCLWSNRHLPEMPDSALPETSIKLIEHECAHLLFPTRGAPDLAEWCEAIDRDDPKLQSTVSLFCGVRGGLRVLVRVCCGRARIVWRR